MPYENENAPGLGTYVLITEEDELIVVSDDSVASEITKTTTEKTIRIKYTREEDGYAEYGKLDLTKKQSRIKKGGTENAIYILRFTQLNDLNDKNDKTPKILFRGKISKIELNTVELPLTDKDISVPEKINKSYRITDLLYVSDIDRADGEHGALIIQINPAEKFSSRYDSIVYLSNRVNAERLTGEENGPKITILYGQPLMRELRTDHIATDMNGEY